MIVKICGITNDADAHQALRAGADWIGLNLVAGPRKIDPSCVSHILSSLDDPSRAVVLASLEEPKTLDRLPQLRDRGVRILQVYGSATPSILEHLHEDGFDLILPWPVRSSGSLDELDAFLADCGKTPPHYVLLDADAGERLGGTGKRADWDAIAASTIGATSPDGCGHRPSVLLAGGLHPENVADAIPAVRPAGVDVSSGVESSPGHKDHTKVTAFVSAARAAARNLS